MLPLERYVQMRADYLLYRQSIQCIYNLKICMSKSIWCVEFMGSMDRPGQYRIHSPFHEELYVIMTCKTLHEMGEIVLDTLKNPCYTSFTDPEGSPPHRISFSTANETILAPFVSTRYVGITFWSSWLVRRFERLTRRTIAIS